MTEIEQLKELEAGKTYYLRLPNGTPREEMVNLSKAIGNLKLECIIIVGSGEFDIEEIRTKGL